MGNRPPYNYDENADDSYPPRDSYPPQQPMNIDDPRFGGGAPTPPRDAYPPQGEQYPPQNQPPVPPADPRYPDYGGQTVGGQYPPAANQYPPAGGQGYRPQGGQIDLNDPRYGGGNPSVPPAPNRGANYPPPQQYPPQQPQGGQYPPAGGPISLDDPNYGGRPVAPPRQPAPVRDDYEYDRRVDLGDVDVPRRGGRRAADVNDDDNPLDRINEGASVVTERQVESIAWGSTIILLGIALIFTVTGSTTFLTRLFPMLSGFILLSSSIYQRLVRGWRVSPLTWFTSLILVAYTITLFIDIDTGGSNIGLFDWIAYFLGTLIILTGITMLLRAFRR